MPMFFLVFLIFVEERRLSMLCFVLRYVTVPLLLALTVLVCFHVALSQNVPIVVVKNVPFRPG